MWRNRRESVLEKINNETHPDVDCGVCKVIVEEDSEGLFCDLCNTWFHNDCNEMPLHHFMYALLNEAPNRANNIKWFCDKCVLEKINNETTPDVDCGVCKVIVEEDSEGLFCDVCNTWFHNDCNERPLYHFMYALLNEAPNNIKWFCDKCIWDTEKWIKEVNSGRDKDAGNQVDYKKIVDKRSESIVKVESEETYDSDDLCLTARDNCDFEKEISDESDEWISKEENAFIKRKKKAHGIINESTSRDDLKITSEIVAPPNMSEFLNCCPEMIPNITDGITSVQTKKYMRAKCDLCPKSFIHLVDCAAHKLRVHEGIQNPYKCIVCERVFDTKKHRERHMLAKHSVKQFACEVCNKGFMNKWKLKEHMPLHAEAKPFECPNCDKRCGSQAILNNHMLGHIPNEERPYPCDECDKRFSLKSYLKIHKAKHSGAFECICDICGKRFITQSALKQHAISHSDERPHKCNICDKTFKKRNALHVHIKFHKKIITARCHICGYGAIAKYIIERHIKEVHTNEAQYECNNCGCKYKTKGNLTKHQNGLRGSCRGNNVSDSSTQAKRKPRTHHRDYVEQNESEQEDSPYSYEESRIQTNNNRTDYASQYYNSLFPPNITGITSTFTNPTINS